MLVTFRKPRPDHAVVAWSPGGSWEDEVETLLSDRVPPQARPTSRLGQRGRARRRDVGDGGLGGVRRPGFSTLLRLSLADLFPFSLSRWSLIWVSFLNERRKVRETDREALFGLCLLAKSWELDQVSDH